MSGEAWAVCDSVQGKPWEECRGPSLNPDRAGVSVLCYGVGGWARSRAREGSRIFGDLRPTVGGRVLVRRHHENKRPRGITSV